MSTDPKPAEKGSKEKSHSSSSSREKDDKDEKKKRSLFSRARSRSAVSKKPKNSSLTAPELDRISDPNAPVLRKASSEEVLSDGKDEKEGTLKAALNTAVASSTSTTESECPVVHRRSSSMGDIYDAAIVSNSSDKRVESGKVEKKPKKKSSKKSSSKDRPKKEKEKEKEKSKGKEKEKDKSPSPVIVKKESEDEERRQLARKIPSLSRFKNARPENGESSSPTSSSSSPKGEGQGPLEAKGLPPLANLPAKGRVKIHSTKSHQIMMQGPDTSRVVTSVARPIDKPLSLNMVFESDDCERVRIPLVLSHLRREGKLSEEAVLKILEKALEILKGESNVLTIQSPCTVFGDVHGQFYDVINLLEISGAPPQTQCLFLGDYVDRGMFGLETVLYLLSYKINFPQYFWLLRGNHESRQITQNFNFHKECCVKYSEEVYEAAMAVFDALPLAAVVQTNFGNFFCVHGGIGPDVLKVRDIRKINRFMEAQLKGPFASLLWSDPINPEEYPDMTPMDLETFFFRPNEGRGSVGWLFGHRAVNAFLSKNKCVTLIRGHEVQQYGIAEHYFGVENSEFPKCITVFSAPNYCEIYNNKAAFLKLLTDSMDYEVVEAVEHPYILPDFMNGISFSLSFVVEIVAALLLRTAHYLFKDEEELSEEQEARLDEMFKNSKASVDLMKRQREERMQYLNKDITKYFKDAVDEKPLSKFEMAVKFDKSRGGETARPKIAVRRIRSNPF